MTELRPNLTEPDATRDPINVLSSQAVGSKTELHATIAEIRYQGHAALVDISVWLHYSVPYGAVRKGVRHRKRQILWDLKATPTVLPVARRG